jgi:hypothetical protein
MSNEKIIDRIKKLLALGNNAGATEAEAATAMAKVSEILAEHNLTMSQVDAASIKDDEQVQGHKGRSTNRNNKWEVHVFAGAAELNFCFYYTNNQYNAAGNLDRLQHVVVGKPVNVIAAELLADYLVATINKMAKAYSVTGECCAAALMAGTSAAMATHRYKQGMSIKLRRRMDELKVLRSATQTKTSDGRNLPALQDAYDASKQQIDLWMAKADLNLRTTQQKLKGKSAALHHGLRDGEKVNLDQQIGGSSAVPSGFRIGSK